MFKRRPFIFKPNKNDVVDLRFIISGFIPTAWLKNPIGFWSDSLYLEVIRKNGGIIMGTNLRVSKLNWLIKLIGWIPVYKEFSFEPMILYSIQSSKGLVSIRISGQKENEQSVLIPLIVKPFNGGISNEGSSEAPSDFCKRGEQRFGGVVDRLEGYTFQVYSNDHGKHFHVIHRGNEINARFSFPEIDLLSYANKKNTLSSKEVKRIKDYFSDKENIEKIQREFDRRDINTV